MEKLIDHRNLLRISLVFAAAIAALLTGVTGAQPASAADIIFYPDGPATGGYVGQQVEIRNFSSGNWDGYSQLSAHFAGKKLTITNSDDDPVELITDSSGSIPSGTYYFRVPLAPRGANQVVFEGPKTNSSGEIATKEVQVTFSIGLGINVSKVWLPNWNTGSIPVGGWLRIYGSGFGSSSSDEMLVILWDGEPVRYFWGTSGGGQWSGSFPVPETTEGWHVIEVFSRKQPIDLSRPLPNTGNLSGTGRGTTNSESNGVLLPTRYKVYSEIKLYQDMDHGRPGDRITINGTGFGGSATITAATVTMSMYTSAPYLVPTTNSSNAPVTVTTNSRGSFSASILIPDLQGKTGPAVLKVQDSSGRWDFVPFNIDAVVLGAPTNLTPANGATFLTPRPTFTYSAVAGTAPVTYEVQIDNNSDFSSPTRWARGVEDTDWTPGDPLQPGIYYWRVRAVDGASRTSIGPWSSPWSFTITNIAVAAGSLASGWNMFSAPIQTASGKFSETFAISDTNRFIWKYDANSKSYILADTYEVGKAYWVKANNDTLFQYEGMATPGTANFTVSLDNGWTQIANPFVKDLNGSNIRVVKDGLTRTVLEAQADGWMVPYAYFYNPVSRVYEVQNLQTAILKSHIGYWVKTNVAGVSLQFQPA